MEDDWTREQLKENFELQLDEIIILQSMFPGPKELDVDPTVIHDISSWTRSPAPHIPSLLDFTLKISCGSSDLEVKLNNKIEEQDTKNPIF